MSKHYSQDDLNKLKELIREGCVVYQEVEDLQGGLNDTIKAISEEMGIKASTLKKVIRTAHKKNAQEVKQEFEDYEDLLDSLNLR